MIPDVELLSLLCTILTRLEVGEFTIKVRRFFFSVRCHDCNLNALYHAVCVYPHAKVNHRKILDGIFEVCGVPPEKIRPISSAVDKLDKVSQMSYSITSPLR